MINFIHLLNAQAQPSLDALSEEEDDYDNVRPPNNGRPGNFRANQMYDDVQGPGSAGRGRISRPRASNTNDSAM